MLRALTVTLTSNAAHLVLKEVFDIYTMIRVFYIWKRKRVFAKLSRAGVYLQINKKQLLLSMKSRKASGLLVDLLNRSFFYISSHEKKVVLFGRKNKSKRKN